MTLGGQRLEVVMRHLQSGNKMKTKIRVCQQRVYKSQRTPVPSIGITIHGIMLYMI